MSSHDAEKIDTDYENIRIYSTYEWFKAGKLYYTLLFGAGATAASTLSTYIHYTWLGFSSTNLSLDPGDLVQILLRSAGILALSFASDTIYRQWQQNKFRNHRHELRTDKRELTLLEDTKITKQRAIEEARKRLKELSEAKAIDTTEGNDLRKKIEYNLQENENITEQIKALKAGIATTTTLVKGFATKVNTEHEDLENGKLYRAAIVTVSALLIVASISTITLTALRLAPLKKADYCINYQDGLHRLLFPTCVNIRWGSTTGQPYFTSQEYYEVGRFSDQRLFMGPTNMGAHRQVASKDNPKYTLVIHKNLIQSVSGSEAFDRSDYETAPLVNDACCSPKPQVIFIDSSKPSTRASEEERQILKVIGQHLASVRRVLGAEEDIECIRSGEPISFIRFSESSADLITACDDGTCTEEQIDIGEKNAAQLRNFTDYIQGSDFKKKEKATLLITGFASPGGSVVRNLNISRRRAFFLKEKVEAIVAELPPELAEKILIRHIGRGESWPFADEFKSLEIAQQEETLPFALITSCP